jgi:hypothetical protein
MYRYSLDGATIATAASCVQHSKAISPRYTVSGDGVVVSAQGVILPLYTSSNRITGKRFFTKSLILE